MAKEECKIIIDGAALIEMGKAARKSPEVRAALESPEGKRLVWQIANGCEDLGVLVSKALGKPDTGTKR